MGFRFVITIHFFSQFSSLPPPHPVYDLIFLVCYLFYWGDPIRTSLVFAIIALTYFLRAYGGYSTVSLASSMFLAVFTLSFVFVQYANLTGSRHFLHNRIGHVSEFITRDQFQRHAETVFRVADALTLILREAILFSNVALTFKVRYLTFL